MNILVALKNATINLSQLVVRPKCPCHGKRMKVDFMVEDAPAFVCRESRIRYIESWPR